MMRAFLPRFLPLAVTVLLPFSATAQGDRMQWIYNRYVERNPLDTYLGLIYGIPETDAMQASITCSIGANWIYATGSMPRSIWVPRSRGWRMGPAPRSR